MANRTQRTAAGLIPVLAVVILLYSGLSDLQIALSQREIVVTLVLIVAGAVAAGIIAAFGGYRSRAVVLTGAVVLLLDVAVGLPRAFDPLTPTVRRARARDERRVADIRHIRQLLEQYLDAKRELPAPAAYSEGVGALDFWQGWWDTSTTDVNRNGRLFLDFLVESGITATVPLDPLNEAPGADRPLGGRQYVYYFVPAGYGYQGGVCTANAGHPMYLLGVSDLESESGRPPSRFADSGCACLWRNRRNFFKDHFDYVVCGRADRE